MSSFGTTSVLSKGSDRKRTAKSKTNQLKLGTMLKAAVTHKNFPIFSLKNFPQIFTFRKKIAVTRKIFSDDENIFAQGPKIFPSGHTQIEQNTFHIFFFKF